MPPRKIITPEALAALGARALASTLVEHAETDALLRKKLRMLLARGKGPDELATALGKRIQAIGRARSQIESGDGRNVLGELDHIRTTLSLTLALQSPEVAISLLWSFIDLAETIIERAAGTAYDVESMFEAAMADLGRLLAIYPAEDSASLARRLLAIGKHNDFLGRAANLRHFSAALGAEGRAALRQATNRALAALPRFRPGDTNGRDAGKIWLLVDRLMVLADLDSDPDAYIAAVSVIGWQERHTADIAERLLGAGRAAEALHWLDQPRDERWSYERETDLRINAMLALGRAEEAQSLRWSSFQRSLRIDHVRAYLAALPGSGVAAEQSVLETAANHEQATAALAFFIEWPALDRAAQHVRQRLDALDGRDYRVLRPAAQALEAAYPDAAALLYRCLTQSVLDRASSRQYTYAARDLAAAMRLAAHVPPGGAFENGADFLARLRARHGRKAAFWTLTDPEIG